MTSRRGFFGKLLGGVVAAVVGPRLARRTSVSLWQSVDGAMPALARMPPVENYACTYSWYDPQTGKSTSVTPAEDEEFRAMKLAGRLG